MFCELHTRSAFSFLSSGSQPQRLAARAAELGMPAAALLDRDTVAGAVRFHFEARERGIKPIIGAERCARLLAAVWDFERLDSLDELYRW